MTTSFQFSRRSLNHLEDIHPQLAEVAHKALAMSRVDFTIISGKRSHDEQLALVKAGASQTMKSKHLDGRAIDFVPLDPETGKGVFNRSLALEVAVAFMDAGQGLHCPVTWGGLWRDFEDIPHIEMLDTPQT